jgi:hypothetical protein
METQSYKVRLNFTTAILGSVPHKDIFAKYIQTKARELDPELAKQEVESIQDIEERGATVFFRNKENHPCFLDYQIKGYINEAAGVLKDTWPRKKKSDMGEGDWGTYIGTVVKKYLWVFPRQIPIQFEGEVTQNQRPLRGMTPQGPRVSLVTSEQIENAWIEFEIKTLNLGGLKIEHIEELLSYGQFQGCGQWRTGGHGRFEVAQLEEICGQKPKGVRALGMRAIRGMTEL